MLGNVGLSNLLSSFSSRTIGYNVTFSPAADNSEYGGDGRLVTLQRKGSVFGSNVPMITELGKTNTRPMKPVKPTWALPRLQWRTFSAYTNDNARQPE